MKKSFVRACCALACFGSIICFADVYASAGTGETDSLIQQLHLHRQLDFISTHTIPMLDEAVGQTPLPELTPPTVEGRLEKLERSVPMTYNNRVQSFIDKYSSPRYQDYLSRMMGLGTYYFRIYDQVFEEVGVPTEIKYLSVIESALNPHAVSRMGATGPWQFMFATAKMYGLQMDSEVDERKDPIAASYAAARYLKAVHEQFGDWLLAIAAYNCGPGNVARAIRRSGQSNPDFWSIIGFLPKETQNYVPAYIAMTYMIEYHKEHGIEPAPSPLGMLTEVVSVQQSVSFSAVADALNVGEQLIRDLNPAYKRDRVKGSFANPRRLILPAVDPTNYAQLYAVLNRPQQTEMRATVASDSQAPTTHRVSPGESLARIADRYDVTVQDLKAWNNLRNDRIVPGQRLEIQKAIKPAGTEATQIYTVKKGDTLSTIAAKFKTASVSKIKAANGLKTDRISPGMKLKIQ